MAAILQCIIRHCFDAGDESGGSGNGSAPPMSRRMSRSVAMAHADSIGGYSPATIEDPHDDAAGGCDNGGGAPLGSADTLGEESHNHRRHRGIETGSVTTSAGGGLPGLFSRLGFGGGDSTRYDTLAQMSGGEDDVGDAGRIQDGSSVSSSSRASPLRSASSFDYDKKMRSIPSIQLGEILMPGSDLQKKMSAIMAQDLESSDYDECVICMVSQSTLHTLPCEPWFPLHVQYVLLNIRLTVPLPVKKKKEQNPRMPTLCGCGENKTYFHLPCLYQWIEQSKDCPSCRKRLRWEEF